MATASSEILEALESARPQDAIEGVKSVVRNELRTLDPSADIEDTPYFNHSFAPDFVLTWRDGRRRSRREVFLRPSVFSGVADHELQNLAGLSSESIQSPPMVVALRPERSPEVVQLAREATQVTPRVLLTDVDVIENFAVRGAGRDASPIQQLVRANLAKGGRGLLLEDEAAALLTEDDQVSGDADDQRLFLDLVRGSFDEQVATSILRTSQIIAMARTGDLSPLQAELGESAEAVGGRLTMQELQLVLPYVLRMDGVTTDARFWTHLGSMLTLADIEEMSEYLAGLDLTTLVTANLGVWTGNRAAIALYLPDDEIDEEQRELAGALAALAERPASKRVANRVARAEAAIVQRGQSVDPRGRWMIHAHMLSAAVGDWRLHIGANGLRLKPHESPSARLDAITHLLPTFQIQGLGVDGAARSFAWTSASVAQDIQRITQIVEDDYHLRSLTITGAESGASIEISYRDSLVTARSPATVRELGQAALLLLGYRRPVPADELDRLLPPVRK